MAGITSALTEARRLLLELGSLGYGSYSAATVNLTRLSRGKGLIDLALRIVFFGRAARAALSAKNIFSYALERGTK